MLVTFGSFPFIQLIFIENGFIFWFHYGGHGVCVGDVVDVGVGCVSSVGGVGGVGSVGSVGGNVRSHESKKFPVTCKTFSFTLVLESSKFGSLMVIFLNCFFLVFSENFPMLSGSTPTQSCLVTHFSGLPCFLVR